MNSPQQTRAPDPTISPEARVAPVTPPPTDTEVMAISIGMGSLGLILFALAFVLWFVNRWLRKRISGDDSDFEDEILNGNLVRLLIC